VTGDTLLQVVVLLLQANASQLGVCLQVNLTLYCAKKLTHHHEVARFEWPSR
jgi:hypothetical protein